MAVWSPTQNSLAYVTNETTNIYLVTDVENPSTSVPVTDDGVAGEIFNGVPDWLYEEEILSSGSALWWSPDDAFVAFGVFNENGVKAFQWTHFGDPTDSYVETRSIRYPKAGTSNPTAALKLVKVSEPSVKINLTVPATLSSTDHYLMQVRWLNASFVSALWMDRLQQRAVLAVYDTQGGTPAAELQWTTNTWIENYPYASSPSGREIFLRLPRAEEGRFVHLARVVVMPGMVISSAVFLTAGQWEVTGIVQVGVADLIVTATVRGPETRHLFRVLVGGRDVSEPMCLTCAAGGVDCGKEL